VALVFNPATAPPLQFYLPSIEASASSLVIEASGRATRASSIACAAERFSSAVIR
jgi:hypothetical protein